MRKTTSCYPTTAAEKRQRKIARDLARYHANMADPAFRAVRAAKERARWAAGDGARRNAIDREETKAIQAHRAATAPPEPFGPPIRECSPERLAYKRRWRQEHRAELNARRASDRQASPGRYREWEKAAKDKKRAAVRSLSAPENTLIDRREEKSQ